MARKQFLKHLRTVTGSAETVKSVITTGEIAIKYADAQPELYIRTENDNIATFIDSTAISNKISSVQTTLEGAIDAVAQDVLELSGVTEAFSASVETELAAVYTSATTFATEAANAAKDAAKADAVASSKTYTDAVVDALSDTVDAVDGKVLALSGATEAFSASVETELAAVYTSATTFATEAANAAKAEAIASSKTYTDAVAKTLEEAIDAIDDRVLELSGVTSGLAEELKESIKSAVTKAYIYKGSVETYDELPSGYGEEQTGYVYNVKSANGNIPAGTNYAWNGTEWDALGGTVDLTIYATSADTHSAIAAVKNGVDEVAQDVLELSGATEAFSASVETELAAVYTSATTFATEAANAAKDAAKADAVASSKTYTDAVVDALSDTVDAVDGKVLALSGVTEAFSASVETELAAVYTSATTFATEAANAAKDAAKADAVASSKTYTDAVAEELNGAIDAVDKRVVELEAISAKTESAVQNVIVESETDGENKHGIKVSKGEADNIVRFNFDSMVIDCGTF